MIIIGWELMEIFISEEHHHKAKIFDSLLFSPNFFRWKQNGNLNLILERKICISIWKTTIYIISGESGSEMDKFKKLFNSSILAQISNFRFLAQLLLENILRNDIQKLPCIMNRTQNFICMISFNRLITSDFLISLKFFGFLRDSFGQGFPIYLFLGLKQELLRV